MTKCPFEIGDRVIVEAKSLRPLFSENASSKDHTSVLTDTYKVRRVGKVNVQVKGLNGNKILRVKKDCILKLQESASAPTADFW